jgi:hypothetical protein
VTAFLDRHQEKLLEAHSISTTRLTLQSFLPPSGRNGKAHWLAEIWHLTRWFDAYDVPTGCSPSRSNCSPRSFSRPPAGWAPCVRFPPQTRKRSSLGPLRVRFPPQTRKRAVA